MYHDHDKTPDEARLLHTDDTQPEPQQQTQKQARRLHTSLTMSILLNVILAVLLTVSLQELQRLNAHATAGTPLPQTPARMAGAIEYEMRHLPGSIKDNPFAGDPRPELEAAWHDLLAPSNIRVTEDDLARSNVTSLKFADGSGYIAQLGMYHELHCLKRIRHWAYRDTYHANDTDEQVKENKAHIDHCIEILRENSMCRGEDALSTFTYLKDGSPTAHDRSMHRCVKQDKLLGWVNGRTVSMAQKGLLEKDAAP